MSRKTRTTSPSPPVRCPKCRGGLVRATYLPLRAALRKLCHSCGHLWDEQVPEKVEVAR